jgi:hypothetical protein
MKKESEKVWKGSMKLIAICAISVFAIAMLFNLFAEKKEINYAYEVGNCMQMKTESAGQDQLKIYSSNNSIIVEQQAYYTCCANISVSAERKGNSINITEKNTGDVCKCMCTYPIKASVTNLEAGNYNVQVFGIESKGIYPLKLLGESSIAIK